MPDLLYLSHDGRRIGTLERSGQGAWRLVYDAAWRARPDAFPLSPHLVLRERPYDDVEEDGLVEKFFDNLLPEGDSRSRIERRLSAKAGDAFDLLRRFGRETAGAITISSDEALVPDDEAYTDLPRTALLERVRQMREEGGSLLLAARMSLAGAQDKMAVRMQTPAARVALADGMQEPDRLAPTTHILKPEPPLARKLPHAAPNEAFCMAVVREIGVSAPQSRLLYAPGPDDGDRGPRELIYAVECWRRPKFDPPLKVLPTEI
jgi:serine/threonine-protein kinase HipA